MAIGITSQCERDQCSVKTRVNKNVLSLDLFSYAYVNLRKLLVFFQVFLLLVLRCGSLLRIKMFTLRLKLTCIHEEEEEGFFFAIQQ